MWILAITSPVLCELYRCCITWILAIISLVLVSYVNFLFLCNVASQHFIPVCKHTAHLATESIWTLLTPVGSTFDLLAKIQLNDEEYVNASSIRHITNVIIGGAPPVTLRADKVVFNLYRCFGVKCTACNVQRRVGYSKSRLTVFFKQEQSVIDNEGTNKGMTTAEEAEDDIRRAMMKEVSRIGEKIKQNEEKIKRNKSILCAMKEKNDSKFLTNNNWITTVE